MRLTGRFLLALGFHLRVVVLPKLLEGLSLRLVSPLQELGRRKAVLSELLVIFLPFLRREKSLFLRVEIRMSGKQAIFLQMPVSATARTQLVACISLTDMGSRL